MNRKNLIIFFAAAFLLVGACTLVSHPTPTVQPTSTPESNLSQPEVATQPPLSGENGQTATQTPLSGRNAQSGSLADFQGTFPLPPDSQITSPDLTPSNDPSGGFTIHSQSGMAAVVKYYTDTLPAQGWISRYTDANFIGGVTQYWKKDNIYLSLNFGFDQGQLTIHCQYNTVEAQPAQKLPKGFPLPVQSEMVQAEATSWEFYVPQDYAAVTDFYNQQMASMNWKSAPVVGGGGQGSCGGDDCGGNSTFPSGALPTATIDPRQSNQLSFTMPDGNEIVLTIRPHQNGTILNIDLTLKSIDSAGLPKDVPVYLGAVAQIITPGMAEFQVNADMKTLEDFYTQQLTAAGWAPDGAPIQASGSYLQNWKKGDQSISITLVPSGTNTGLVIMCSTCMK